MSLEDSDTALPRVTQGNLTIDASNAGVILDGGSIKEPEVSGLEIASSGNIVRGLQIVSFTGPGILVGDATNNMIGGQRKIGTGPLGQGNLVSKNGVGIRLSGTSDSVITGNMIGTDPTGTLDWGNMSGGITGGSARDNVIGPANVIAHNGAPGVMIRGTDSYGNTITRNSIHDNACGIQSWEGANAMLAYPLLAGLNLAAGTIRGSACPSCTIEIFSATGVEGNTYEGRTRADSRGLFAYAHGQAFTGPYVSATATDADGNTSGFPQFVPGYERLQVGNTNPTINVQPKPSYELEDNRIGIHFSDLWQPQPEAFPGGVVDTRHIVWQGVTRARFAATNLDLGPVLWDKPEIPIDPRHDAFITELADNGIAITYVLQFWDQAYVAQGGRVLGEFRFRTKGEVQRYLNFVRYTVRHLKDRVEYFEIWNEPNNSMELPEYLNLVKKAITVIRQEYPEAKIVVGGVGDISNPDRRRFNIPYDYFLGIIESKAIMPLVDVVSWHGMYSTSPEFKVHRQYYYNYPALVGQIKKTARAHGFRGEFVSDEMFWGVRATPNHTMTYYSETRAAKYYARGILMNLGLDLAVSQFYAVPEADPYLIVQTIRNLTTLMSGMKPSELPVKVQSKATNIVSYEFAAANGDTLIALWADGVASDVDLGSRATVTVPGLSDRKTTAIDVVYGFEQEIVTQRSGGNLVIRDLLVRDSPLVLRFSQSPGSASPGGQ